MRAFLLASTAAYFFVHSTIALAQTTPAGSGVVSDTATSDAEEDSGAIIFVTAQRREESLQDAALPIDALGAAQIARSGISDPQKLNDLIPALVVQPTGLSSSFFIRGVGAASLNSFQENAVAFNVGGVYYSRPSAPVGSFYDLERIEVVKGPQGTLYGRNATAGAINLIPRQPELGEVGGNFSAEYGNYDSLKLAGAINLPLGAIAALRVATQIVDRDGYLSDGYDDENGWATRAQLLIEPSDGFSALLAADYYEQRGMGIGTVLVPSPQTPNAPSVDLRIGASDPTIREILRQRTLASFGFPPFSGLPQETREALINHPRDDGYINSEFYGVSLTLNADLGFADGTAIFAYRKSEPDTLTYPGFPAIQQEDVDQYSAEFRLASNNDGPLEYVVGAFYFSETADAYNFFDQGLLATTVYRPLLKTDSVAVFGELTFHVNDQLRLLGGARYTIENKNLAGDTRSYSLFNPNSPTVPISGDLDYKEPDFKVGVEFDVTEDNLLYATVSTGFKAGGFFASAGTNTFAPERLTAYTFGSKNQFLDDKLTINLEGFYWQYTDQQLTYVGPVQTTPGNFAQAGVTVNAGRARIFGAELDIEARPTSQDRFGATVQYLNSKYNELEYAAISASGAPLLTRCVVANDPRTVTPPTRLFIVDCSGRPGLNSPKWSINLNYDHRFDLGGNLSLTVGANTHIESASWINLDYLDFQRRDGFMRSSAFAEFEGDAWSLTAFVDNIENETVFQGSLTRPIINVTLFSLRPPRTYGLRFAYDF